MLGVICGAVHVAEAAISKKYVNFKSALERYDLSVNLFPLTCSLAREAGETREGMG